MGCGFEGGGLVFRGVGFVFLFVCTIFEGLFVVIFFMIGIFLSRVDLEEFVVVNYILGS